MRQVSLTTEGFEKYRKTTKKELFLKQMDKIIVSTGAKLQ